MILTHFSDKEFKFDPFYIYNEKNSGLIIREGVKPHGLWMSDESDFGWSKWCEDNDFNIDGFGFKKEFNVNNDSRLCILQSYEDIELFTNKYDKCFLLGGLEPIERVFMNWPEVYKKYSGIIITPYCWEARLEFMWYYGWDCASACIWDLSVLTEVRI